MCKLLELVLSQHADVQILNALASAQLSFRAIRGRVECCVAAALLQLFLRATGTVIGRPDGLVLVEDCCEMLHDRHSVNGFGANIMICGLENVGRFESEGVRLH